MAVSWIASSAGTPAGQATTAALTIPAPALPAGTATGDRVFLVVANTPTTATAVTRPSTPAGWNLGGSVLVGSGAALAAGTGSRMITVFYRDKDTSWSTIPSVTVASAANHSGVAHAHTMRKLSTEEWRAPQFTSGSDTTSATSFSGTGASIPTYSAGAVIIGHVKAGNVTSATPTFTQTGATFSGLTERADNGIATGYGISLASHTALVTTGATAAPVSGATLSAAQTGGVCFLSQGVFSTATSHVVQVVRSAPPANYGPATSGFVPMNVVSPTFTVQPNDIIAVLISTGALAREVTAISGGTGVDWTPSTAQKVNQSAASDARAQIWAAKATTAETISLTLTINTNTTNVPVGYEIYVIRGMAGFGATGSKTGTTVGTISNLNPVRANSLILYVAADWNGVTPTNLTWLTANAGPETATTYAVSEVVGRLTHVGAFYNDIGAINTPTNVGFSNAITGTDWTAAALELVERVEVSNTVATSWDVFMPLNEPAPTTTGTIQGWWKAD